MSVIRCRNGGQVVVGECLWVPGAYLSTGNHKGAMGAVVDPLALDQLIAELTRVRDTIAAVPNSKPQPKDQAA
jgi:hypothetical protein